MCTALGFLAFTLIAIAGGMIGYGLGSMRTRKHMYAQALDAQIHSAITRSLADALARQRTDPTN